MKLVFQIAGGLLLFVVVMVLLAGACLALVANEVSDVVADWNATATAEARTPTP